MKTSFTHTKAGALAGLLFMITGLKQKLRNTSLGTSVRQCLAMALFLSFLAGCQQSTPAADASAADTIVETSVDVGEDIGHDIGDTADISADTLTDSTGTDTTTDTVSQEEVLADTSSGTDSADSYADTQVSWPEVTDPETLTSLAWSSAAFGPEGTLPVSFVYGGVHSSALLPTWEITHEWERLVEDFATWTVTAKDPTSGLVMTIQAVERYDYASVEWVVTFENGAPVNTPILESVHALSGAFGPGGSGDAFTIHHGLGSHAQIDDFTLQKSDVAPGSSFDLAPYEGRSSDGALPFVNIEYPGEAGVMVGIGWTGQWAAHMERTGSGPLQVNAGMELTHLRLYPGEKIRTPSIALLFYNGADFNRGQVLFSRLVKAHYSPTAEGVPAVPPIAAAPAVVFESVDEASMLGMIQQLDAHDLPVDTFWMDAGWFKLSGAAKSWATSVGNFEPDPVRFPNGLGPIAAAAHAAGLDYLLWFEPERVMPDTTLFNEHPEWLITPPNDLPPPLMYQLNDGFHLLNLGNDDARAWLTQKVSSMIESIGVDIYRHDFNLYPLRYWRQLDAPDRQGMTEIRHIMGLYDYFDALLDAHPGLRIDNCASGGRRIDLETLKRAFVLTRSDYLWDPKGQQNHTFGLSKWLPTTGIGAASLDTYSVRSGYGSHFVLAQNYNALTPEQWAMAHAHMTELSAVRALFDGDFVTLTGKTDDASACVAFATIAPDASEGVLQVFRREACPNSSQTVVMAGLNPAATYLVEDLDDGSVVIQAGSALMNSGLPVSFATQPQAKVYRFKAQ